MIARLELAETAREDIGDHDRIGKGARFFDDGPKRPDMNSWKSAKTRRRRKQPRPRPGPDKQSGPSEEDA